MASSTPAATALDKLPIELLEMVFQYAMDCDVPVYLHPFWNNTSSSDGLRNHLPEEERNTDAEERQIEKRYQLTASSGPRVNHGAKVAFFSVNTFHITCSLADNVQRGTLSFDLPQCTMLSTRLSNDDQALALAHIRSLALGEIATLAPTDVIHVSSLAAVLVEMPPALDF